MRLQNLFSTTLGITFLASFVIVAGLFYRSALSQAEQEAMREARMMLAAATAARSYNSGRVTPLLAAQQSEGFAPESIPSFATQAIMKGFNAAFPEYAYRETALNPTNLDDLPRSWEADIIHRFRQDPALTELSGERTEDSKVNLYIAQPIRITDPGCLTCHSDPKSAPASLVAAYGTNHGFGWKHDEVIGAKFIVVPKSDRLASALSNVFWFLIALGSVLIVAVLVTVFMVRWAIAGPAQRLARQAERLSVGEHGMAEILPEGASEFRTLAGAINRMHRSLMLALKDVEDTGQRAGTRTPT
jgi:methyl-accepting chemotaxis protein